MAVISKEELWNRLKRLEFAPVYVLFGVETYLRDLAAKKITDLVLADSSLREFNEIEHSLKDSRVEYALADAEQLPMMSSRRIVKVTDIIVSANSNKDNLKETDEAVLESYLRRPAETSIVIFIADELDRRRKISKLLLENSASVEFTALNDFELRKQIQDKARNLNTEVDEKASRLLIALLGEDLRKITVEIEKLAVAALPDRLITEDLVETLVPNSREISNFDLTDNLLAGNKSKALQVLKKILDDGAEPLMLLGLIANNFHRLFLAKELMNQGVERREVARIMKLPPFKQEEFLATARRAEAKKLSRILQRIADADLAVKTSKATPRLQIEMLVCELTQF